MRKRNLSTLLATSVVAATPYLAHAYPIFYKCDANRGFSDVLTGPELDQKIKAFIELPKAQKLTILSKACEGLQDCKRQLGQIADLAEIDRDLAQKTLENELNKLQGNGSSPIRKVSSETYDLQKAIRSTYFETAACRNTLSDLPSENFLTQGEPSNQNVLIYFPYESEYTYVTGCRPTPNGGLNCMPNQRETIEKAIRGALLMGADPYAYLALGLMEGGANGWTTLYLDPIGKMKAMGCREGKSDVTKGGTNKLNSFGNFHEILAGTHRDPELSNRLKKYLTAENQPIKNEKSYFCRELSTSNSHVLASPDKDQCCLELDFSPASASNSGKSNNPLAQLLEMTGQGNGIEKAFVFEHVRQVQNSQLPGKTDPAFRLQHFNGFSKLMGGGEGVSTFRSGVNYYDDPAYGYQAMDYIMNSLATNPWIRSEVERQAKELKVKTPGVLCLDVPVPGVYQIDSDAYFKKHHDTPRLKTIRGKKIAQMSEREKKVFMQELTDPKVSQLLKAKLGDLPFGSMGSDLSTQGEILTTVKMNDGSGYKVHMNAGLMTPAVAELKVEKIGNYSGQIPKDYSEVGLAGLDIEKAKKGFSVDFGYKKQKIQFFGDFKLSTQDLQTLSMGTLSVTSEVAKITYSNGWVLKPAKDSSQNGYTMGYEYFDEHGKKIENPDFNAIVNMAQGGYKLELSNGSGYTVQVEQPKANDSQNPFGALMMMGSNKKTIQYADGTEIQIESEFKQIKKDKAAQGNTDKKPAADLETVAQTYWSEVYSKRDTISKSSPLPWAKISDERLKEIAQKIRNNVSPQSAYQALFGSGMGGGLAGGLFGSSQEAPAAQPSIIPTPLGSPTPPAPSVGTSF